MKFRKKRRFRKHFQTGDLIYCFDNTMNKSIYGQIISIYENKNGTQDLVVRWTDMFVAVERCNSLEALKRLESGLWKLKPMYRSIYGKVRSHS
tara:strand:- start:103 stop:381 length:279 start_codon:yes stop_codon:yes gene_type:complete